MLFSTVVSYDLVKIMGNIDEKKQGCNSSKSLFLVTAYQKLLLQKGCCGTACVENRT